MPSRHSAGAVDDPSPSTGSGIGALAAAASERPLANNGRRGSRGDGASATGAAVERRAYWLPRFSVLRAGHYALQQLEGSNVDATSTACAAPPSSLI